MRINTPSVNHQSVEGEIIAINLGTGAYYSIVDLGARLWERVDAGLSAAAMAEEVARQYPGEPDAAALSRAFLDELTREGLIVADDRDTAPLSLAPLPQPFSAPRLEKFTDMQELLLLDPIHEVDQAGWPVKPR